MQTDKQIRRTIKKLHVALNQWPHNTPVGRKKRSHFGKKIERLQVAYENMAEGGDAPILQ